MREPILTITATDKDCSPTFGSVCSYSITREAAIIMGKVIIFFTIFL